MRTLRLALGLLLAAAPLAAQRRAGGTNAPANPDAWPLAIGTQAGFVNVHVMGSGVGGDLNALMFPAWGSSLLSFGVPLPTVPSLYMIVPVANKLAIEPGVDINRAQSNGPTTRFGTNLTGRLDYAFGRGFYGAAGLGVMIIKATGVKTFGIPSASLAGGYRFHFSGAWGGRVELSHTMNAKHATTFVPPINVTALTVGAMVSVR